MPAFSFREVSRKDRGRFAEGSRKVYYGFVSQKEGLRKDVHGELLWFSVVEGSRKDFDPRRGRIAEGTQKH